MKFNKLLQVGTFALVLLGTHLAAAQERSLELIVESNYFSIYAPDDFNIPAFLQKVDFDYSVRPENLPYSGGRSLENILAKTIDALYSEVSDILDIHVYSYYGMMKILRNKEDVSSVFYHYFKRPMPERGFYLPEKKTLYLSDEDIELGILGHEMGHAIIGAYFVVPPPAKMQEVLCGYVEYNLRKKRGTLPQRVK